MSTTSNLYMSLVHYPVYNKHRSVICSAVTTMDLHDLARLGATYGLKGFFVVTPLRDQRALAERVKRHWTEGYGAEYNAHRKQAFKRMRFSSSVKETIEAVAGFEGTAPLCIATDASRRARACIGYRQARDMVTLGKPVLLFLGTAWGLTDEVLDESDYLLEPIHGPTRYNHLSVRAAAAIILDRLAAPQQDEQTFREGQ